VEYYTLIFFCICSWSLNFFLRLSGATGHNSEGLKILLVKGKAVPLQAWTGPEGSRKLRLPDFVTTAQDGGRMSALCTGRLYPQEIFLVLISVRG